MTSGSRQAKPVVRLTEEERAAKVEALMRRLTGAVSALTEGAQWAAMLSAAAKLHRYSFRNMIVLHSQAAERGMDLTAVAGFHTWRSLGRTVRKGERGLAILAPITRRPDDDIAPAGVESGRRVVFGVRVVHVFDISQTAGKPLPEPTRLAALVGEDVAGLWDRLSTLVHAAGYELQRRPETGPLQGWTDYYTSRVVSVRPDIDGIAATAVLAHELGHIRADHEHRDIPRAQMETEAESIAHIVMDANGMDSAPSAVPYIAGWSRGDTDVIAAAAETVHTVAAGILADLTPEPVVDDAAGPAPTRAARYVPEPGRRPASGVAASR